VRTGAGSIEKDIEYMKETLSRIERLVAN
jgi:hypothetical protein